MNDVATLPARFKLSVDAYEQMIKAEIFGQEDRVELIEGELIDMAPIGEGHVANVGSLNETLVFACQGRGLVLVQCPIRVGERSLPEPDLAILRRRTDFYASARPGPADVLLLIEVSDSSLSYDRNVKRPLYARNGIAEFWIVDLRARTVDVHREPVGDGYAVTTTHRPGDQIALALAPEIVVKLALVFA